MIRLRLEISGAIREYAFHRPEIHIGRSPTNDLAIPLEGVSVRHGRLFLSEGAWRFEDRDSVKGTTRSRDGRVEVIRGEVEVEDGDRLNLGGVVEVEILSTSESLALGEGLRHRALAPRVEGLSAEHMALIAQMSLAVMVNPRPSESVALAAEVVGAVMGLGVSRAGLIKHGRAPAQLLVLVKEGRLRADRMDWTPADRERILELIKGQRLIHHPHRGGTRALISAFDDPPPLHASAMFFELEGPAPDEAGLERLAILGAALAPVLQAIERERDSRDALDSTRAENRYFRERQRRHYLFKELVTESASMRTVYRELNALVERPGPVLLIGDAGSGKELIARAVHHLGERSRNLMVTRNCSDEDPELLDLELFGAGARGRAAQLGVLELANGGTVFLNQIDRLPMLLQSKLLRVIKEGELRRHGEEVARTVDVRLVLSTHCDLGQLVAEGRFRKDLYVAIQEGTLRLPSLVERLDDIMPLVQIFVGVFARRYGLEPPVVDGAVEARLRAHTWPGNVRELQSAVESAVLKHTGGVIGVEDFGF